MSGEGNAVRCPEPAARPTGVRAELTVGAVAKRAFDVWTGGFLAFSTVVAVAHSPVLLFWLLPQLGVPLQPIFERRALLLGVGSLLTMLVNLVATGAVTHGVAAHRRGGRIEVGAMLDVLFRRGPGLLAVALASRLAVLIGLALLIVPGVYLSGAFWVALPSAAVERTGVVGSLRRSSTLTREHLTTILGVAFLLNVFVTLGAKVLEQTAPSLRSTSPLLAIAVYQLGVAILFGLPAVASAVAYHDLRAREGGPDAGGLARVFE